MPVATQSKPQAGGGGAVPFLEGSWSYREFMAQDTHILGTTSATFSHQITPGGFLRGVSLFISSATGVLGTSAALVTDAPFSIFGSMSLVSIDGTDILYPMNGYSYYLVSRFARPWDMDPAREASGFSNTINPKFRLRFFVEGRITIGVLPNTDSRAQYRFQYTLNPLTAAATTQNGLVTKSTGVTAPKVTITIFLETYAQPPQVDYAGNAIVQIPDGLTLQRFCSHQSGTPTNTGTNTIKENRVGNLIRLLLLAVRGSNGKRVNLTSNPIRWRLDNTQLLTEYRTVRTYETDRFGSQQSATQTGTRPTGVYPYFRFHNPGQMDGDYWLATTEASYLQFELNGGPASGTLETITEDLAPAGPIPAYLRGL